jgi:hypothetical protein
MVAPAGVGGKRSALLLSSATTQTSAGYEGFSTMDFTRSCAGHSDPPEVEKLRMVASGALHATAFREARPPVVGLGWRPLSSVQAANHDEVALRVCADHEHVVADF